MHRRALLVFFLPPLLLFAVAGCTEIKQSSELVKIPFKTIRHDDPSLFEGRTKIVQHGKEGLKTATFSKTYKWGKEVKQDKIKEVILRDPTTEIINVGTKKSLVLTIKTSSGEFELNLTAASRLPVFEGEQTKLTNAVVVKGTIKNIGKRAGKTGRETDLAILGSTIKNGPLILSTVSATTIRPGETAQAVWASSLSDNRVLTKSSNVNIEELNVVARSLLGPRNSTFDKEVPLKGIPSIQ